MSFLKWWVNFSSIFVSFFILMTHNTSISFLRWAEGSLKSRNFGTFWVSLWKYTKFIMPFSKPQASFPYNLASFFSFMKKTFLYFFKAKNWILCRIGPNQNANSWGFWVLGSKFTKFLSFLKKQISFFSTFASLFRVMRHENSSVLFWMKF